MSYVDLHMLIFILSEGDIFKTIILLPPQATTQATMQVTMQADEEVKGLLEFCVKSISISWKYNGQLMLDIVKLKVVFAIWVRNL